MCCFLLIQTYMMWWFDYTQHAMIKVMSLISSIFICICTWTCNCLCETLLHAILIPIMAHTCASIYNVTHLIMDVLNDGLMFYKMHRDTAWGYKNIITNFISKSLVKVSWYSLAPTPHVNISVPGGICPVHLSLNMEKTSSLSSLGYMEKCNRRSSPSSVVYTSLIHEPPEENDGVLGLFCAHCFRLNWAKQTPGIMRRN